MCHKTLAKSIRGKHQEGKGGCAQLENNPSGCLCNSYYNVKVASRDTLNATLVTLKM